jgi:excisionase family DNA binding protein
MARTLTEAAARLGVAASTLRVQIRNGKLRGKLVGKTWTVTNGEIERYRAESLRRPK